MVCLRFFMVSQRSARLLSAESIPLPGLYPPQRICRYSERVQGSAKILILSPSFCPACSRTEGYRTAQGKAGKDGRKQREYLFADEERILCKRENGLLYKFVWDSEDDWVRDGELSRMYFGDFRVRPVSEEEVPELKKIALDCFDQLPRNKRIERSERRKNQN